MRLCVVALVKVELTGYRSGECLHMPQSCVQVEVENFAETKLWRACLVLTAVYAKLRCEQRNQQRSWSHC